MIVHAVFQGDEWIEVSFFCLLDSLLKTYLKSFKMYIKATMITSKQLSVAFNSTKNEFTRKKLFRIKTKFLNQRKDVCINDLL